MNPYNNPTGNERNLRPMHYSPTLLSAIYHGIENCKLLEVEYESREKGTTKRTIEPMSVILKFGKKHLVGWCRLRNDYRTFIVDRLNCVKVKSEGFERRPDYDETIFMNDLKEMTQQPAAGGSIQ